MFKGHPPGVPVRRPGPRPRGEKPPRGRSGGFVLRAVPLFVPAAAALGIDLVHFGVLVVVNARIGRIAPPCGILPFANSAVPGTPLRDIAREIPGFLGALICFPGPVPRLPRQMGDGG